MTSKSSSIAEAERPRIRIQIVFVCGGNGTRLTPRSIGPKSLMVVGGSSLLARLIAFVGGMHQSNKPPIVIVAAHDLQTPEAVDRLLPGASIVRQSQADGVANALLLAAPFMDELVFVVLGDLFFDGSFATAPTGPALTFWHDAPESETQKNFGIKIRPDNLVHEVIEKPFDSRGLRCGVGVYVLTRSMIYRFRGAPIDPRTGERGITSALQQVIETGDSFQTIPFVGYYNNVNAHDDVTAVERYLARPRP
jgi:dTDP-glucose pyrophosphorylase